MESMDKIPPDMVLTGLLTTICTVWTSTTITVDQVVEGSSPFTHPIYMDGIQFELLAVILPLYAHDFLQVDYMCSLTWCPFYGVKLRRENLWRLIFD